MASGSGKDCADSQLESVPSTGGAACAARERERNKIVLRLVCDFEPVLDLPQLPLRVFVLREIPKNKDDPAQGSIRLADGRAAVVDGNFGAVFPDEKRVVRESDDLARAQHEIDRAFHRHARGFVDDAKNGRAWLADGFLPLPGGQLLGHVIHEGDAGLGIGNDHRISDARQADRQNLPLPLGFQIRHVSSPDLPANASVGPDEKDKVHQHRGYEDRCPHVDQIARRLFRFAQTLFFCRDNFAINQANFIHLPNTDVRKDEADRGRRPLIPEDLNRVLQLANLLIDELLKTLDQIQRNFALLSGIAKMAHANRQIVERFAVGLEIFLPTGKQKSTLPGFQILQGGKNLLHLAQRRLASGNFLRTLDRLLAHHVSHREARNEHDSHHEERHADRREPISYRSVLFRPGGSSLGSPAYAPSRSENKINRAGGQPPSSSRTTTLPPFPLSDFPRLSHSRRLPRGSSGFWMIVSTFQEARDGFAVTRAAPRV